MKIAVAALQGAFLEHEKILDRLGIEYFEIRKREDAEKDFDGLILPGGESTTMGKLLDELDLFDILKAKIENGLPVFGTCAGLILLAKQVSNDDKRYFGTMDITVRRNAYGRQLGSFETTGSFGKTENVPMVFIRAPYIEQAGDGVEILSVVDGKIVAARQKNQLVTAFHPELVSNYTQIHQYFIDEIVKNTYTNLK
ncbi:MAG: pyridoxal 5'-phosphate synthase glutaminase subunit PdxT [Clostridia bacterium]|nr:pyridoxal 5'-phosphate synthase glutaminase subunit PdxT [Clostridia bacterium]